MATITRNHLYTVDLNKPLTRQSCGILLAEGDNNGDCFSFELVRDGMAVIPGGALSVTAYFIRDDGNTVFLTGESSNINRASVTLPQSCYIGEGRFSLAVKVALGGVTTTIAVLDGYIKNTQSDTLIDPGSVVPSLDELFAQIAAMEAATAAAKNVVAEYEGKVAEQDASIAALTEDIDNGFALPVTWEDGAYINYQGVVSQYDGYSFGTVDVQKIAQISVATVCYDKTTAAFYNDNGVFISAVPYNDSRVNPYKLLLEVPAEARYFKFSCMTYAKEDAYVKFANIRAQIGTMMTGIGGRTNNSNLNLTNADDALPNTIYSIQQGGGIVANMPAEQGTLITYSYSATDSAGRTQVLVTPENRMFWRIRWTDWSNWKEVPVLTENDPPLYNITGEPGKAAIFRKFCCIGDSLASGEHEYIKADGSIGYIDLYEYSWGQYMARAVGGTCYNLSKGGATTRTWLVEFASRLPETLSDCYIIALGVNDANPDSRNVPVGSLADCHATNHTLNADTYYGNYDQIIRRIHTVQPRAKIFCVTNPQGGANAAYNSTYNKAVRDMVARHNNCYLLDLWEHAPIYNSTFREMYFNGGHMNAAGYLYTAHMFMSYIDWYVKNNPTDFAEVAFIGTDYSRQ